MRYSVHSNQDSKILKEADEIIILQKDMEEFPSIVKKYPNKKYIIEFKESAITHIEKLKMFRELTENLIVKTPIIAEDYSLLLFNNIKFFSAFPVSTFYDCNALKDLGVEYITITMPLTHSMKYFNNFDVKLRMCPNVSYDAFIPRLKDGLFGQWVRPEDIKYYENVYVFDFEDCDKEKEKTLLKIYKSGKWNGNLNLLFTNFNINVNNITLPEELGEQRANCRQKCQSGGACKFCETAMKFSGALLDVK